MWKKTEKVALDKKTKNKKTNSIFREPINIFLDNLNKMVYFLTDNYRDYIFGN